MFSIALLGLRAGAVRLPGDHSGYEPAQPIAYSHRLADGEEIRARLLLCDHLSERDRAAEPDHRAVPDGHTGDARSVDNPKPKRGPLDRVARQIDHLRHTIFHDNGADHSRRADNHDVHEDTRVCLADS